MAVSANLILLPLAKSISGAALIYALFSLVSSASATPANLLIMETQRKSRWASAFARFSMISSVGTTLGLLLGIAWSSYPPDLAAGPPPGGALASSPPPSLW